MGDVDLDADLDLPLPDEARVLLDAVLAMGSDRDLAGVLQQFVETSCRLTGAQYGVLGTVDGSRPFESDESGAFIDLIVHGMSEQQIERIGTMPAGHGLIGAVPEQRTSMRVDHISDHPESVGFPRHHPPMDRFLGAPVLVRGQAFGHLYLGKGAKGEPFTPRDQALLEGIARAAGVIIDHARAYAESERQRAWLDASVRISAELAPVLKAEDAVAHLVSSVQDVVQAQLVAVVQDVDGVLEIAGSAGASQEVPGLVDRLGGEIRKAVESGEVVRVERDRLTTLVVPLDSELARPGVLLIDHSAGWADQRADEQELVAAFARQLGVALDRVTAIDERHELLLAKDRDRIARDLHDLIIQRIFATGMQLMAAKELVDDTDVAQRIGDAVASLDIAIRDLRTTIYELGRGSHGSLLESVRGLLREYAVVLGFVPLLRSTGPVDRALAPEGAAQALLALREALSNVARHAQASSATVELDAGSAWFAVRVSDDGVGLPAADERADGHGLANLRHRAEALGGRLDVAPGASGGTVVEWVVPALG